MTKVDEIGVVGKNRIGGKTAALQVFPEQTDVLSGIRFGLPLALILGKHAETGGAHRLGVEGSIFYPSGNANMGS